MLRVLLLWIIHFTGQTLALVSASTLLPPTPTSTLAAPQLGRLEPAAASVIVRRLRIISNFCPEITGERHTVVACNRLLIKTPSPGRSGHTNARNKINEMLAAVLVVVVLVATSRRTTEGVSGWPSERR